MTVGVCVGHCKNPSAKFHFRTEWNSVRVIPQIVTGEHWHLISSPLVASAPATDICGQ